MNDSSITSLPTAPEDDRSLRMTRYLVLMGIRLLCFGLVLWVPGWWKLAPAILAVVLPYFAVLLANAGDSVDRAPVSGPGTIVLASSVPPSPVPGASEEEETAPPEAPEEAEAEVPTEDEHVAPENSWYDPRVDLDPFPLSDPEPEASPEPPTPSQEHPPR